MLENPQKLRDRSEVLSDPLSQILDLLDARCIMSGAIVARGAWARRFPQPNTIKIMAVAEGACWLSMACLPAPLRLGRGDVILVNGKHSMVLSTDPALPPPQTSRGEVESLPDIGQRPQEGEFLLVGGHIAVDPARQDLLLDVLPPLVHAAAGTAAASTLDWLLDQLVRENRLAQSGADVTTALLAQLLFVQSLRAAMAQGGEETRGWLKALGDERLAPALRLIHSDPARNWTLVELARACAMSRTSFALRFRQVAGVAPLGYLFSWRMRLAERSLRERDIPVSVLARELGYASESAFSNAFKRATGLAPRRFRLSAEPAPLPAPEEPWDGVA